MEKEPTPEQRIAAAVIRQALLDAGDAKLPEPRRAGARAFFAADSAGLRFWVAVSGLDSALIRQSAARALGRRFSGGRDF